MVSKDSVDGHQARPDLVAALVWRSYATTLYKSGMGIKAIQAKTRHANTETLMRHYVYDDEAASGYLERALA